MRDRPIVEINFGQTYVHKPHNRHNTNVIMVPRDVDTIEERPSGLFVTKEDKGKRFFTLYPWPMVHDVKYLTEELETEPPPPAPDDGIVPVDGFADEPPPPRTGSAFKIAFNENE